MKYFVIFGLLIFLGITLFIDVFKIIIGSEYHSGLKVVPAVLLANLFMGIYFNLSLWYKLSDKTWMGAWIAGIGAVLTIISNVLLIPTMGYMGSAYGVLICFVIMTIISYIVGQKYYRVEYDLKRILIYIAISIGFYFLSDSLHFSSLIMKYTLNISLFAAFLVIVFFYEKNDIRSLLKR
jgi:O-antigen/teichoic acid export membrane protein